MDHSFERGLSNVTAQYSLKDGGGVVVKNRGFSKDADKRSIQVVLPQRAFMLATGLAKEPSCTAIPFSSLRRSHLLVQPPPPETAYTLLG